ncbi:MAG TPA: c-type cytochrome [Bryobacteraceae bacterium]|nr:c-type cytochrome [Bryobacteraceae bacterium]
MALLSVGFASVHAQTVGNATGLGRRLVEEGGRLFSASCAPCHGRNGEGAQGQSEGLKPPDLTSGVFRHGNRDEDVFKVIANGVPGTGMPSFEPLGADAIRSLVAFVRSLSRSGATASGDAASGEALFWGKGNCGRCHTLAGRGGNLGPNLNSGRRRNDVARLKQSIVAPDDEIAEGYEVVSVTTPDGKTMTGIARFYDSFSVRLLTVSGEERTFFRDELTSVRRDMRSLMPADYGKRLSPKELDDLVAYIVKVRQEAVAQ